MCGWLRLCFVKVSSEHRGLFGASGSDQPKFVLIVLVHCELEFSLSELSNKTATATADFLRHKGASTEGSERGRGQAF